MANVRRKEEEHTLQSAMEWFGANFQPRNNWTEIQKILLMVCLFHSFFLFSSISVNWTERMVFSKNSKKKQNSIWNHLDSILNIIWSSVQGWKIVERTKNIKKKIDSITELVAVASRSPRSYCDNPFPHCRSANGPPDPWTDWEGRNDRSLA